MPNACTVRTLYNVDISLYHERFCLIAAARVSFVVSSTQHCVLLLGVFDVKIFGARVPLFACVRVYHFYAEIVAKR